MAVGKAHKQKRAAGTAEFATKIHSQPPAAPASPPSSATRTRKNKKKKGKGKDPIEAISVPPALDHKLHDGDLPALEHTITQKTDPSPVLESIHVTSTTISHSGDEEASQLQTEALAKANDHHSSPVETTVGSQWGGKRPQRTSQTPTLKNVGMDGTGMVDDEYWSSFPPHIKTFVSALQTPCHIY